MAVGIDTGEEGVDVYIPFSGTNAGLNPSYRFFPFGSCSRTSCFETNSSYYTPVSCLQ